jgi:hypothetical protein
MLPVPMPLISDYTLIGSKTIASAYGDSSVGYSWEDGDNSRPVAADLTSGMSVTGTGTGFTVTADASVHAYTNASRTSAGSTTRALFKVYVGVHGAAGKMTAALSDSSAPVYMDTSIDCSSREVDAVYTFDFTTSKAGGKLVVTWEQQSGTGTLTLQAAAIRYINTGISGGTAAEDGRQQIERTKGRGREPKYANKLHPSAWEAGTVSMHAAVLSV